MTYALWNTPKKEWGNTQKWKWNHAIFTDLQPAFLSTYKYPPLQEMSGTTLWRLERTFISSFLCWIMTSFSFPLNIYHTQTEHFNPVLYMKPQLYQLKKEFNMKHLKNSSDFTWKMLRKYIYFCKEKIKRMFYFFCILLFFNNYAQFKPILPLAKYWIAIRKTYFN